MITTRCSICNTAYHSHVPANVRCQCGAIVNISRQTSSPPTPIVNSPTYGANNTSAKRPLGQVRNNHLFLKVLGIIIASVFLFGLIGNIIVSISKYNESSKSIKTSNQATYHSQSSQSNDGRLQQSPATALPTTPETKSTQAFEICKVRIVNTFNGTDKTGTYRASLNEAAKILTLTYQGASNEVLELTYQGGNASVLRFYLNGELQIEKEMFRRRERETESKHMLYTSRTNEVQLTITYD